MQHLIDNMQTEMNNEDLLLELNKVKSNSKNRVLSDLHLPAMKNNSRKVSINLDKYTFIA